MTQLHDVSADWRVYRNPEGLDPTVPATGESPFSFSPAATPEVSLTYTLAHLVHRTSVPNDQDLCLDEVEAQLNQRGVQLRLGDVLDHRVRGAYMVTPAGLLEVTGAMRRQFPCPVSLPLDFVLNRFELAPVLEAARRANLRLLDDPQLEDPNQVLNALEAFGLPEGYCLASERDDDPVQVYPYHQDPVTRRAERDAYAWRIWPA